MASEGRSPPDPRRPTRPPDGGPGRGLRVARVAGIDVRIDQSWLIAFALIGWSLASGYYPRALGGLEPQTYWVLGAVSALALFGSVLLHEFAHSLVARARGLRVRGITLFIFGGASEIEAEAERPLDEFLIAVVGPLTSLAIGAAAFAAAFPLREGTLAAAVVTYVATINVILGLFNLVPGFPLDGGRVLRAAIWAWSGSLRKAQRWASYAGQMFGLLLVFWGVNQVLSGNVVGGIWIGFIGWFLNSAAQASRQQLEVQEDLQGISVGAVMDRTPPVADSRMSVRDFVYDHALREGERAMLIVEDDRLVGIVTASDVKDVPQERWAERSVGDIMTRSPLRTVTPETDLATAVGELATGQFHQLPVLRDGRVVGLIGRGDVLRALALRDELHLSMGEKREKPRAA